MTRTYTNRRKVLKTIGAGVVGGSVLTVSVSAQSSRDVTNGTIELTGEDKFEPGTDNPATVTLGGSSPTVTFENIADPGHSHNVNVHEEGDESNKVKSQLIESGETYTIELKETNSGQLKVSEVVGENAGGTTQSITVPFPSGGTTLHMHCDLHDIDPLPNFSMHGTMDVSR